MSNHQEQVTHQHRYEILRTLFMATAVCHHIWLVLVVKHGDMNSSMIKKTVALMGFSALWVFIIAHRDLKMASIYLPIQLYCMKIYYDKSLSEVKSHTELMVQRILEQGGAVMVAADVFQEVSQVLSDESFSHYEPSLDMTDEGVRMVSEIDDRIIESRPQMIAGRVEMVNTYWQKVDDDKAPEMIAKAESRYVAHAVAQLNDQASDMGLETAYSAEEVMPQAQTAPGA